MFPTRGNFHGPGGGFVVKYLLVSGFFLILNTMKIKRRKVKKIAKSGKCCSMKISKVGFWWSLICEVACHAFGFIHARWFQVAA